MRANEFLHETIEIICEKTTADELIPYIEPMGFDVEKKTGNTLKVIVPAVHRFSSVKQIADTLPGSEISPDGKIIYFDGAKILVKPAEAQGGRLEKEEGQIISLDSAIKEHLGGRPFVKLAVGTRVVNAAGAKKVPGTAKADAEIVDDQGNPVAWISLKDGSAPRNFGQWGGVDYLGSNPEVADFINKIKAVFGNTFPNGPTYGVEIKDPHLKALTVFGKDYGGVPGRNNVDLVLQGHPTLKKGTRGSFVLTGAHTWENGDIPEGPYEPTLMVRFAGDRGNFGIAGARVFSYPASGRPWQPLPKTPKQPANPKKPDLKAAQPQPDIPAPE